MRRPLMPTTQGPFRNIALAGNEMGIRQLLAVVPSERVRCIIAPSIRPALEQPVRILAAAAGSTFASQPKYGSPEYGSFLEHLGELELDLLISNNYSMIIRPDVIEMLKGNCLNVHWALLPANRGPNPVQWAIIRNEKTTGVTLHFMDQSIDSGDIVAQRAVEIADDDTWKSLAGKLESVSFDLLHHALPAIFEGRVSRYPQDEAKANSNRRLTPDSPRIDFNHMSDREIYNLIRAQVKPLSGAYIESGEGRIYFPEWRSLEQVQELRKAYSIKH